MRQNSVPANLSKFMETPHGIFFYEEYAGQKLQNGSRDNTVRITSYEGMSQQLQIPARINACEVSAVGKKAFLGNRFLQSVSLPDTIEEIGDWAFSGCRMLQSVTLPKRDIILGNQVFRGDGQLREISIADSGQALAGLTAAAATLLSAEYLIQPLQVGSERWYRNLDVRILEVLEEPEEAVLKELVYCAEEDMYEKQEALLKEQAHRKARIALIRLIYPEKMAPDVRGFLTEYLCQRTKGCKDEAAWELVKKNGENQLPYCEQLFALGGIHEGNIQEALADLDNQNVELKAYLLQKWQSRQQNADVWDTLKFE